MPKCLALVSLGVAHVVCASLVLGQGIGVGVNGQAVPPAAQPVAQPAVVEVTPFEATGALAGAKSGGLTLQLLNKQVWQVLIDSPQFAAQSKTQMELHAPAKSGLLQPGLGVRFTIMLDVKGRPTGPIEKITIFSPNNETRFGAFTEEQLGIGLDAAPAEAPANGAQGPRLGIGIVPGGDGQPAVQIGVVPDQPKKPEPPKRVEPKKVEGKYLIVGQVNRLRKDELSVSLPGKPMMFKITPETQFDAEFTDKTIISRVLQAGDPIQVTGFYQVAGTAYATQIKINLERALGEEAPNKFRKPDGLEKGVGAAAAAEPQRPFVPDEAAAEPAKPAVVRVLKIN
jgi:hypothetical protein